MWVLGVVVDDSFFFDARRYSFGCPASDSATLECLCDEGSRRDFLALGVVDDASLLLLERPMYSSGSLPSAFIAEYSLPLVKSSKSFS